MKIKGFKDTIKWYDENSSHYAESSKRGVNLGHINKFTKLLPSGALILDAGCGAGRDSNLIKKKKLQVIGLDISSGLIKLARKKYPKIKFFEGDIRNLPFVDEYFNAVWARACLLHFEKISDVRKAISEFSRVLKKGGIIHILVRAQTGKRKTIIMSDSVSGHDRFFRLFKKNELSKIMKDIGFKIIKIEQFKETNREGLKRPGIEWVVALATK